MRSLDDDARGPQLTRRRAVLGLMAAAATVRLGGAGAASPLLSRSIPSSGETIPVVGLGTWRGVDVGGSPSGRGPPRDVPRKLPPPRRAAVASSPAYPPA